MVGIFIINIPWVRVYGAVLKIFVVNSPLKILKATITFEIFETIKINKSIKLQPARFYSLNLL